MMDAMVEMLSTLLNGCLKTKLQMKPAQFTEPEDTITDKLALLNSSATTVTQRKDVLLKTTIRSIILTNMDMLLEKTK